MLIPKIIVVASTVLVAGHAHTIKPHNLSAADLRCLTDNVYFEARGEPERGQLAVVAVTLNRLHDPQRRFGSTVCRVVHKPYAFSWTLLRKRPRINRTLWAKLHAKVERWTQTGFASPVGPATHFHTPAVNPRWNRHPRVASLGRIGNHLFFQEK